MIQSPTTRLAIPVMRIRVNPICDRCISVGFSTLNQPMRGPDRTQYRPDPANKRPAPGGTFNSFPYLCFGSGPVVLGAEKS